MPWTREQQLEYLVRLPWSVTVETDSEGDLIAHVAELPFVTATGITEKAVSRDLYDALETTMRELLESGEELPSPHNAPLPWTVGEEPTVFPRMIVATQALSGSAWETSRPISSEANSLVVS